MRGPSVARVNRRPLLKEERGGRKRLWIPARDGRANGPCGRCGYPHWRTTMATMNLLSKNPAEAGRDTAGPAGGVAAFDRRVIVVGAVVFAVLLAVSTRYGFHRDELYFIECARHLQASYVDQPVLTPLLAWVSLKLFGVSLLGLRMWAALAAWATVVLAGLTAREFGGGRRAQLLAAIATATMPVVLGGDHLFGPTAFDILAWAALALVVARIGRTGDARWWPLGGLVLGLGLANKHSVGLFAVALVIGVLLAGGRRLAAEPLVRRRRDRGRLHHPRHLVAGAAPVGHDRHVARARARERRPGQHRRLGDRAAAHERPGPGGGLGGRAALPVAVRPAALARPGVGVRDPVRVLRAHDGREDLLPGGRVYLPPGRRGRGHRRVAGRPRRPAPQAAAGHGGMHRARRAAGAAGAASRRRGLDPEDQPGAGRIRGLAAAGRHGPHGVVLAAGRAAGQRGDLRVELR